NTARPPSSTSHARDAEATRVCWRSPMGDELDARIRALQAERARPERREPTVEELMQRLIGTLHALYTTPPDDGPQTRAAARLEDYTFLRENDVPVEEAARRVGVSVSHALRRYESALKKKDKEAE